MVLELDELAAAFRAAHEVRRALRLGAFGIKSGALFLDEVSVAFDEVLVLASCRFEFVHCAQMVDVGCGKNRIGADYAATLARIDSKRPNPSVEPNNGFTASSGCGIRPRTVPRSLMMPAMSFTEPLGFASGSGLPFRST